MKKVALVSLFAMGTMLFVGMSLAAAPDEGPITGTWECQAKGGSQGDTPFTLYLTQKGETVEGSVSSPMGGTQITSATFKDNTLEIHIDSDDANYVLSAKLDKGVLTGTWANGDDKGTWEGKKQAEGGK